MSQIFGTRDGCPVCGARFVAYTHAGSSTGGYDSPPGHDHDDNEVVAAFLCQNGHVGRLQRPNRCHVQGCEWVDMSPSARIRVDEWPDVRGLKNMNPTEMYKGKNPDF